MAYVEYIRSSSGETWAVRDKEAHEALDTMSTDLQNIYAQGLDIDGKSRLFAQTDTSGAGSSAVAESYPTLPGVYRISTKFAGLPSDCNYGVLLIFNAGAYTLHLYLDKDGSLYYSFILSGSTIAVDNIPTSWSKATHTTVSAVTG